MFHFGEIKLQIFILFYFLNSMLRDMKIFIIKKYRILRFSFSKQKGHCDYFLFKKEKKDKKDISHLFTSWIKNKIQEKKSRNFNYFRFIKMAR